MNLFELFVKIGVDDQASKNIGGITTKLGNGLKKAAGIGLKAVTAASAGIAALTGAAVKNYAEYEQLVGGVETLFKKSSEKVQKYAANAYKTAGLSANEYMSTVTSFSASLLQSLKGDTEKAAEYADMAVSDMSDNANKMGTDMELIQNAYQGFAKQNYTMLDNLKLGYGGTKTEMERLVKDAAKIDKSIDSNSLSFGNIVKAINVVQREMGIYGTTALEAEKTISGSLNAMKGAWSNLITGVADENANFEELIDNMIDSVGAFGGNILPRVEQGLLGVSKLIEKTLPKIMARIPETLSKFAPKLLNSGINILKQLVKGISKNAKTIVNAAKDLVLDFVDGISDMLPDVIDAAVELFSGIVSAIPDIAVKVAQNMPKIIGAIVTGLAQGTLAVGKAIVGLFVPFDDSMEETSRKISSLTSSFTPFLTAVNEASNKTIDLSKALSSSGNTIADIDDKINEVETKITDILKKEFKEQDGLRQKDIESLKKYRDELKKLEDEKMSIYQEQQMAEIRKLQLSMNELAIEDAENALARVNSAYEASNKAAEEYYSNQLIRIENANKNKEYADKKAYKKALDEAKANYDKLIKENEKYQKEAVSLINESSDEWIGADLKKWEAFGAAVEQQTGKINEATSNIFGWEWAQEANKKIGDFMGTNAEFAEAYANALENMDLKAASAFLSMQGTVVASGEVLDEESRKSVESILKAFDNLPPSVDEQGRKTLDSLIAGLESQIPELKDSANMTTKEVLDVLRKKFTGSSGGANPSKEIGKNITKGVKEGAESQKKSLFSSLSDLAYGAFKKMKSVLGIKSPSRLFKNEIGKQIVAGLALGIADYAYMAEDAMSDLSDSVASGFDTDTMVSTSTSSIGDFGGKSQINEFSNPKSEVVISVDDSNAMGLARALLPLLKIAEKEAYA